MALYSDEAVILSVRNWGEADKMVTFFSRDYGKITAAAYGCRRPRSPLAGGMQVFSYLNLQVLAGKNLDTIKQCDTKRTFKRLREDLSCMAYAAFLTELVSEVCAEREPEVHIFDVLLEAFEAFMGRNPRIVALTAAFQVLEYTGYQPSYDQCVHCGLAIEETECAYFAKERGGILCSKCGAAENAVTFSGRIRFFIHQLRMFDWREERSFSVNGAVLMQAEAVLLDYLVYVLERPLKSLDFIQQLAKLPEVKPKQSI